jgi:hypothetical protein
LERKEVPRAHRSIVGLIKSVPGLEPRLTLTLLRRDKPSRVSLLTVQVVLQRSDVALTVIYISIEKIKEHDISTVTKRCIIFSGPTHIACSRRSKGHKGPKTLWYAIVVFSVRRRRVLAHPHLGLVHACVFHRSVPLVHRLLIPW